MSVAYLVDARVPCEGCGAPLEEQQRYCVHCGTRRSSVEEPALAWVAARKAARVPAATTAAPPRNPLALPAILLALMPVVAAVGVLAGRGGGDTTDPRLLEALRSQKAPIVRVGDVAAGHATTAAAKTTKSSKAKAGKRDSTGGKVVAKTSYGVAHQITGFKPTEAKVQSDGKLVQKINKSIGKNYLQAQRNLPDTIVVPTGTGGGTSPGAEGRGD
ncbi:MAG TPA: hypothetical protein VF066_03225 [Thermoleophilaceae bacterium]